MIQKGQNCIYPECLKIQGKMKQALWSLNLMQKENHREIRNFIPQEAEQTAHGTYVYPLTGSSCTKLAGEYRRYLCGILMKMDCYRVNLMCGKPLETENLRFFLYLIEVQSFLVHIHPFLKLFLWIKKEMLLVGFRWLFPQIKAESI